MSSSLLPKRPAIKETLSDLPSHLETESRDKAVYPEVVKGDSSPASGKHKTGYDKYWGKTFPWLEYTEDLGSSGGMFVVFSLQAVSESLPDTSAPKTV